VAQTHPLSIASANRVTGSLTLDQALRTSRCTAHRDRVEAPAVDGQIEQIFVRPEVAATDGAFDPRLFGDDRRELIHSQAESLDCAPRADNELFLDLQSHLLIVWSAAQQAGHQPEQNDEDQHEYAPEYDRAGGARRYDGQTLFDV